jgi:hypothetical protein
MQFQGFDMVSHDRRKESAVNDMQVSTSEAGKVLPLVVERQTLLLSVLHSRKSPASPIASINITDPQTARMTSEFPSGRCARVPLFTACVCMHAVAPGPADSLQGQACRPAVAVTCAVPVWQGGTSMHMESYSDPPDLHEGPSVAQEAAGGPFAYLHWHQHASRTVRAHTHSGESTYRQQIHLRCSDHMCPCMLVYKVCGDKCVPCQPQSTAIKRTPHTSILPQHSAQQPCSTTEWMCPRLLIGCWAMAPARSSAQPRACRWTSSG